MTSTIRAVSRTSCRRPRMSTSMACRRTAAALTGSPASISRSKAAKLRIGRVCQGCLIRWRVEAVGAEAGAGGEAQPWPFAELGEHVPGLDAEEGGQVVGAPVARGLAGGDGRGPLPGGGPAGAAGGGA